jgi:2-desacetyl-2-hydroxyethyl bacteriochlorophyllide A dehydrogenase
MRAVVFTEPNTVELQQIPPPRLAPGQILVRTRVTSISPGTELLVLTGRLPLIQRGQIQYPLVPGYENCGEIVEIASGVQGFEIGDRVYCEGNSTFADVTSCWGGHSEYVAIPGSEAFKLPATVSDEEGTFTCLASIALHGVQRGVIGIGDTVAVFGQGVIGLLATQAALLAGADRVIAVDLLERRLELSKQLGASHTVNAGTDDPIARIRELTGGKGCQVVIEVTGSSGVAASVPRACAERGRLVLLGMYSAPISFDYWDIYPLELDILSSRGAGPKISDNAFARWTWASTYRQTLDLMSRGRIRVSSLVTHRLPIKQIMQGYDALLHQPNETLKVILQW